MGTLSDKLRRLFAGVLGIVATALFFYAAWRFVPAVSANMPAFATRLPHDREWAIVGVAVGVPMVIAWLYAAWLDKLLSGPAVVRGLKFGAILAVWIAAGAFLVHQAGMSEMPALAAWRGLLLIAGACLAYGVAVGTAYGLGRQYDQYRSGLAYGLQDRPLLSEPPGRVSMA